MQKWQATIVIVVVKFDVGKKSQEFTDSLPGFDCSYNDGLGTEFSLDVLRPFQMGSMTRVGMKKLLRELRYEVPRSSQKLTSQDLRAYFRSKGILSRERYSAYYSDNFPDIAVTYTWNMCLLNKVKQIEKQIVVIDQNSNDIKSELKIQKQYIESPDITWF